MDQIKKRNTKKKQKIGIIFDEEERGSYLKSFYGKKKLQKEIGKKKKEKFDKDVRKEKEKFKKQQINQNVEEYRKKFDENNRFFKNLDEIKVKRQTQSIKTNNDDEIEVVTSFF